jgi:quinol monooxygenase YgiN
MFVGVHQAPPPVIIRIVKMTFELRHVEHFQLLFQGWAPRIRSFEGCHHLALLHDVNDPRVFFTYSHWDGPDDLEAYRNSDVFAGVWPVVKTLFAAPAEAWSVEMEHHAP